MLRSGYGLFYDGSIYSRIYTNMASQPPFAQASTLVTTPKEVLTLENGFPQLGSNILSNTYALDPNFRTPYAQTWNFSIEDEFVRNVILSIGYVGTKGTKLDLLLAPNQSRPERRSPPEPRPHSRIPWPSPTRPQARHPSIMACKWGFAASSMAASR